MLYSRLVQNLGLQGGSLRGEEFVACCPLHSERNPSFSINTNTGRWQCFAGCGAGSFRTLLQRMHGWDARTASAWISKGAVLDLEGLRKARKKALVQAENTAWEQYYDWCIDSLMPEWFLARGFVWSTIDDWGIRYDSVSDAVVIPVRDAQGALKGTVSRYRNREPKYRNSFNLPRDSLLFGFHRVKGTEGILLVEGVLDAIWAQQCGYPGVALMGTQISLWQLALLQRYDVRQVTLALDNDEAGRHAQKEIRLRLLNIWRSADIFLVDLPEGKKDIQDCSSAELEKVIRGRNRKTWASRR